MASLQEIEFELSAINETVFQQLCDEYLFLSEHNYPSINRTGSQKRKRKTRKGTPDAFWKLPSGQYVFCEYTTKDKSNKKGFIDKLADDLSKCLDKRITGVSLNLINRIILCFNSEIETKEVEELEKVLVGTNIELDIRSLDTLALNLYSRFPVLANKYLGVPIDTGQVLPLETFVADYSAGSSFTIPLNNSFLFREKELEELTQSIAKHDVTLLSGQPGVGKSKLAVQALSKWKEANKDFEIYCLTNKQTNILEDLKSYIRPNKNYVVLLDDANRQSENLRSVLTILATRKSSILKLIITVREYASVFVKGLCKDFGTHVMNVSCLTDEQIVELLKSGDFNIQNHIYRKRILEIAKGNPRVAIMAAMLAIDKQKVEVLHDLYELYETYFFSFSNNEDLLNNADIKKVLGILSFFHTVERSNKDKFHRILEDFGLDKPRFESAVMELEKYELVETNASNNLIRIGDQVLSTYFFYKCFIKDKSLSFTTLLKNYFAADRNRFKDTLVPALQDFNYKNIVEPIKNNVIEAFNEISANEPVALDFIDTFWFCIPEHALGFLEEIISKKNQLENTSFVLDKTKINNHIVSDRILRIMERFFYQTDDLLLSGLELAFLYVEKRPACYIDLHKLLTEAFTFSYEDQLDGFYRQEKIADFLIANIDENRPIFISMFFEMFSQVMKSEFNVHSGSRNGRTISFYQYSLPLNRNSKRIRKKIWDHIFKNFQKDVTRAEEALFQYPPSFDATKEILEYDWQYLVKTVKKYLSTNEFKHAHFVQKVIQRYERMKVVGQVFSELKASFYSVEYKVYRLLDMENLRNKEQFEYESIDFDKFERVKELEVKYKLKVKSLDEFKAFYTIYCRIVASSLKEIYSFNRSLDIIISDAFNRDNDLGLEILKFIQNGLNPSNYTPYRVFALAANSGKTEQENLFMLISNDVYGLKAEWLASFCSALFEDNIQRSYYVETIEAIKSNSSFTYFDFEMFAKFRKFNRDIFPDMLKVFISKHKQGIRVALSYQFFETYTACFKKHVNLLKEAYFICDELRQNADHNGRDMLEILRFEPSFFHEYIMAYAKDRYSLRSRDMDKLSIVWQLPNAEKILEKSINYISDLNIYSAGEEFINCFFKSSIPDIKARMLKLLIKYLKKNSCDTKKVDMVFDVFRHSFSDSYMLAIKTFLGENQSILDFKKLALVSSYYFGSGNVNVSAMRAMELEKILKYISEIGRGTKFNSHKAVLLEQIAYKTKRAAEEREREFLREIW